MTELQQQAQRAKEALHRAVIKAMEKKRRLGQYAVIYENGKTLKINPPALAGRRDP